MTTLQEMLQDAERWEGQVSIEAVKKAVNNPGLCLVKRAHLTEDTVGKHIRPVTKLDFVEGVVEYIDVLGMKHTRTIDYKLLNRDDGEFLIFNPSAQDYGKWSRDVRNSSVTRRKIMDRSERLWELYFHHLLEDLDSGKAAGKVKSVYRPRMMRAIEWAAAGMVAAALWLAYDSEFNTADYEEDRVFAPIHAEQRSLKRASLYMLEDAIERTHAEFQEDMAEYKKGPKDLKKGHFIGIKSPTSTRARKLVFGEYDGRYHSDGAIVTAIYHIVEGNLKGRKVTDKGKDFMIYEIPSAGMYPNDNWKFSDPKEPYVVVIPESTMKVVEAYAEQKKEIMRQGGDLLKMIGEFKRWQRVEPDYKVHADIPDFNL